MSHLKTASPLTSKRAFLLSESHRLQLQNLGDSYDEDQQLNVVVRGDQAKPLVSGSGFGYTASKTLHAPSDDDPDPEDEGCY